MMQGRKEGTPQAEVTDSMIREAFLTNGFTIKDGHSDLKPYVYAAARAILALRPVQVTDEREAFEAEIRSEDVWGHRSLKKRADGRYENRLVDLMWDVWQARAKLAIQQAAESEPVAWMWKFEGEEGAAFSSKEPTLSIRDGVNYVPLYTHPAPGVPDGWKLVPIEPTQEMLAAVSWPECARTDWAHMLSAAPMQKGATQ